MSGDHTTRAEGVQSGQGSLDAGAFGTIWLAWGPSGLRRISFTRPEHAPDASPVPARYAEPLQAYFEGEPVEPAELPVELSGTDFQCRVWRALRRVPRGKVRSYAGIAADVGSPRGMRAVGMANRNNPLPIAVPCHRIVQAAHRLGGYSGGLERKRQLLTLEGVEIEGDLVRPGQLLLFPHEA
jgi:methylated-DNA-[protein]-cysteine S-methyltransferase